MTGCWAMAAFMAAAAVGFATPTALPSPNRANMDDIKFIVPMQINVV
jgi:hypothetical protein